MRLRVERLGGLGFRDTSVFGLVWAGVEGHQVFRFGLGLRGISRF